MKLIVAGSRGFTAAHYRIMEAALLEELEQQPIDLILSGGAKGADTWAIYFAQRAKIPYKVMRAKWQDEDGHINRGAGHARNAEMAKEGDRLVAFWDGRSPGTAGMIEDMKRLKKPVRVIDHTARIY